MNNNQIVSTDILIIGAGPVGLMCAYLAKLCKLDVIIIDKSSGPIETGRADALNARTLQLLEIVGLFDALYPLGKACNTSSIWQDGKFISRQSAWWESLEGCLHRHFLMIGQSYLEKLLDDKLKTAFNNPVWRETEIKNIELNYNQKITATVTNKLGAQLIEPKYIIGADGGRSFVRKIFDIQFEIIKPKITWAVIDGVINSNFPKVPEIIVFQNKTSDIAWIPREGDLDRFYVRMDDHKDFTEDEVISKINSTMQPHHYLSFKKIEWFSRFSVKESVAEKFSVANKIFLVGDACHIHSVNGGQGLNTGIGDAFNLIWKINKVINCKSDAGLLNSYEAERKPVAQSVIETSGKLVRATKFSKDNTHAKDYLKLIELHAGNITGMGVNYKNINTSTVIGMRMEDFEIFLGEDNPKKTRLYSLLDYAKSTLVVFSDSAHEVDLPLDTQQLIVSTEHKKKGGFWCDFAKYNQQSVLVRPDGYIEKIYKH